MVGHLHAMLATAEVIGHVPVAWRLVLHGGAALDVLVTAAATDIGTDRAADNGTTDGGDMYAFNLKTDKVDWDFRGVDNDKIPVKIFRNGSATTGCCLFRSVRQFRRPSPCSLPTATLSKLT